MGKRHLIHVNSHEIINNRPKLPLQADIMHGELAVNYAKGDETISLKNDENEIVSFNIGKSIKGVKVNDVDATITSGIASVTISGSDENVGTYESVQYPQEFTGATNISGSQTIAEAFNAVESTVATLSQELINDELAISNAIQALGDAAGTINEDNEIAYVPDTEAKFISGATSLSEADSLLDAAIQEMASLEHTHKSSAVTIEDAYQQTTYPSEFTGATNIQSGQTVTESFEAIESTVSNLTQEVLDNEQVTEEAIKALGEAAGTIDENNVIAYVPDTEAKFISGATSLSEADSLLDAAIQGMRDHTHESSAVTIESAYETVEYPTQFTAATNVESGQTVTESFEAVESTISALAQEMINDERVASQSIKALGEAAGTINEDNEIEYIQDLNAKFISGATSLSEADSLLDAAIQEMAGLEHTHKSSAVTIEDAYHEIAYPSAFSGATNVQSGQTVTESFEAVESTISALTEEVLRDELVTSKGLSALAHAAGTIDDNDKIVYIKDESSRIISGATSLAEADSLLANSIDNKADKVLVVNHGTADTTYALTPNVHHVWGEVSSLTLTLAAPTDNTIVNEYLFTFTSPTTPTTLSLPATVDWVFELQVEGDKKYVVSIVDNLATYLTENMSIAGEDEAVLNSKEDISNKVTALNSNCTDIQYPSAKCVYDYIEARLAQLNNP